MLYHLLTADVPWLEAVEEMGEIWQYPIYDP